jgi:hypothetical protein
MAIRRRTEATKAEFLEPATAALSKPGSRPESLSIECGDDRRPPY